MAFQNTRPSIAREDFEYAQEVIRKLSDYYSSKVVGQNTLRISMTAAIIADGHILIESVPGLAKTTAAKAVSDAVSCWTRSTVPAPRPRAPCWKPCRSGR